MRIGTHECPVHRSPRRRPRQVGRIQGRGAGLSEDVDDRRERPGGPSGMEEVFLQGLYIGMSQSTYQCRNCKAGFLEDPEIEQCPSCGYNPRGIHMDKRSMRYAAAAGCFLSVILSPLGLYLLYAGRKYTKAAKTATPVEEVDG